MKTILVVDDEPQIVEISKKILERAGYHVMTALNGDIALDLVKGFPPFDLILLDVEMPHTNGYTFLLELKKLTDGRQNIPVIVITAYSEMEPIFTLHGIQDYIVKPGDPNELLQKVRDALNQEKK